MKAAAIQLRVSDDRDANLCRADETVRRAADLGAELVLMPELFSVPFVQPEPDLDYFGWAERLDGPSNEAMRAISADRGITIVSSVFEETVAGVYHNTCTTFVGGELVSTYRKSHLPFSNGFPEKFYFRPGDRVPEVVDIGPTRIGTIICYERHFPELSRQLALGGATVLCVPVASASAPMREVFQIELRAHAIFNSMFVICSNRIGEEGVKNYFGTSAIYDPDGTVIAQADDTGDDEIVLADLDIERVGRTRQRRPFLRDRRPELYDAPHRSNDERGQR